MALLDRWPSERREFRDRVTGTQIWQLTAHPADHHPLFGADSSFTPTGDDLLFTSDRDGAAGVNLLRMDLSTGEMVQVTETDRLQGDQITPAADGRRAIAALSIHHPPSTIHDEDGEAVAIDLETGEWETLAVFLRAGLTGCHLSASGEYVVTTVTQVEETTITAVHTEGMRTVPILEAPDAFGARFSPDSKNSVVYDRRSPPAIHCVEFDGTGDRVLFPMSNDKWSMSNAGIPGPHWTLDIDHLSLEPSEPSWLGSGEEIIFIAGSTDGPIVAVPRHGAGARVVSPHPFRWARSNAMGDRIVAVVAGGWDGAGGRRGQRAGSEATGWATGGWGKGTSELAPSPTRPVAPSPYPGGAYIVLLDPRSGDLRPLCSLRGTGARPVFSPDGRSVVYSDSDEHRHSQLFIAVLTDE
jgi:hypothetical protein